MVLDMINDRLIDNDKLKIVNFHSIILRYKKDLFVNVTTRNI